MFILFVSKWCAYTYFFQQIIPQTHTDIPITLWWCLLPGERVCKGGVNGDVDEKWHRPTECDQASTSAGKTKPASQIYNDDVSLPTWQCVAEVPSFSSFALYFFLLFLSLALFTSFLFSVLFHTKSPFLSFLSFFILFTEKCSCMYNSCNSHGTVLTTLLYGRIWELIISNFGKDYS